MTRYPCCEHCMRDDEGHCLDGVDQHMRPCDQGGPHTCCPDCACAPCPGARPIPEPEEASA